MSQPINPECADGKCRNCHGDAWDNDLDQPTTCGHGCHRTGLKIIGETGPELHTLKAGDRILKTKRGEA